MQSSVEPSIFQRAARGVVRKTGTWALAGAIALKCDGDPPQEGVPDGYQFQLVVTAATTTSPMVTPTAVWLHGTTE